MNLLSVVVFPCWRSGGAGGETDGETEGGGWAVEFRVVDPPLVIQQTFDGVSSEPMSALSLGPCLFAFCCPTIRFRWFDVSSLRMLSFTSNGWGAHGQFLWDGRARSG